MVYVRVGDAQFDPALRAWLERRGIAYQVAWLGLAMSIDESEVEALAERDDVLLIRTPFSSERCPSSTRRRARRACGCPWSGGSVKVHLADAPHCARPANPRLTRHHASGRGSASQSRWQPSMKNGCSSPSSRSSRSATCWACR